MGGASDQETVAIENQVTIRYFNAMDEALDVLPQAVIEILSVGYEEKDLGEDGAPFYLAFGIEVLIVDPRRALAHHYRVGEAPARLALPIMIDLQCGCRVAL